MEYITEIEFDRDKRKSVFNLLKDTYPQTPEGHFFLRPVYEIENEFTEEDKTLNITKEIFESIGIKSQLNFSTSLTSFEKLRASSFLIAAEVYELDKEEVKEFEEVKEIFNRSELDISIMKGDSLKTNIQRKIKKLYPLFLRNPDNTIINFFLGFCYFYYADYTSAKCHIMRCINNKRTKKNDVLYLVAKLLKQVIKKIIKLKLNPNKAKSNRLMLLRCVKNDNSTPAVWQRTILSIRKQSIPSWVPTKKVMIEDKWSQDSENIESLLKELEDINSSFDTLAIFAHGYTNSNSTSIQIALNNTKEKVTFKKLTSMSHSKSKFILFLNCYTPIKQSHHFVTNIIGNTTSVSGYFIYFLFYSFSINKLILDDPIKIYKLSVIFTKIFTSSAETMYLNLADDYT